MPMPSIKTLTVIAAMLIVAAVLGAASTAAMTWLLLYYKDLNFWAVTVPFLALNAPSVVVVAVYQLLLWRAFPYYKRWYYLAPAVGIGVALLILLVGVVLPDTGERDEVQVFIMVCGRPALFWLAMMLYDEAMPPWRAAAAIYIVGIFHMLAGTAMLVAWGAPIWIFDSVEQMTANSALTLFFDPFYILMPFILYQLGYYIPSEEEEDSGWELPVAQP